MDKQFEVEGERYSLTEMISGNCEDTELIEWLISASIGQRYPAIADCVRVA